MRETWSRSIWAKLGPRKYRPALSPVVIIRSADKGFGAGGVPAQADPNCCRCGSGRRGCVGCGGCGGCAIVGCGGHGSTTHTVCQPCRVRQVWVRPGLAEAQGGVEPRLASPEGVKIGASAPPPPSRRAVGGSRPDRPDRARVGPAARIWDFV